MIIIYSSSQFVCVTQYLILLQAEVYVSTSAHALVVVLMCQVITTTILSNRFSGFMLAVKFEINISRPGKVIGFLLLLLLLFWEIMEFWLKGHTGSLVKKWKGMSHPLHKDLRVKKVCDLHTTLLIPKRKFQSQNTWVRSRNRHGIFDTKEEILVAEME